MSRPYGNFNEYGQYGQYGRGRPRQGHPRPPSRQFDLNNLFIEKYQAFTASKMGREDIDLSNNIILPPSALQKLSSLENFGDNKNPLLFQILNIDLNIKTIVELLNLLHKKASAIFLLICLIDCV